VLTTFVLAIANLDYWVGEFGTTRQYPLLTVAMFAVSIFASIIMVKGSADGYDSMRGQLENKGEADFQTLVGVANNALFHLRRNEKPV